MMTRRRWVIAVCTAAALVLVAVLPPRPLPDEPTLLTSLVGFRYYGRFWWGGDRHRYTVDRTMRTLARHVLARQHGTEIVSGMRADRRSITSEREPLRVVYDGSVPPAAAREWLASAEHELALYPRSGVGIPVVVELAAAAPNADRWSEQPRAGRMVVEGPRPTCLVSHFFSQAEAKKNHYDVPDDLSGVLLDRCALYARYGLPGALVRDWLGLADPWSGGWWGADRMGVSASLRRANWRVPPDTVEWFRFDWGIGEALNVVQCLRGSDSVCEVVPAISPFTSVRGLRYSTGTFPAGRVAAHLLASRPADAFVRFWRSDLPVAEALAQAYGASSGTLVREALSRRYAPPAAAHVGVARLALVPVWILVVLGLAWVGVRRKEIVS